MEVSIQITTPFFRSFSFFVSWVANNQLNHWTKRPNVNTLTSFVPALIDQFIFCTLLGATNITQCRTPAESSWKSPTFFVYDPNKSTLSSSNYPNKSTLNSSRVLHTICSTISMAKKYKTEVGEGVSFFKRIPHKYGHICANVGFFFTPFPTSPICDMKKHYDYIHVESVHRPCTPPYLSCKCPCCACFA